MLYFDTSYIVRLYTRDGGWEKVRTLAATGTVACCLHGHAETVAALHRKFREQAINQKELGQLIAEFDADCKASAFAWLPLSPAIIERIAETYLSLPATVHLRAADALHLACAAVSALNEFHTNDVRMLEASSYFGLKGVNVI
jgi:predicted nucleic acid-binding protein